MTQNAAHLQQHTSGSKFMSEAEERPRQRNGFFRFLHKFWVVVRTYFFVIGVLVTLLPLSIGYIYSKRRHEFEGPQLHLSKDKPATIVLDLSGPIAEKEPDFTAQLLGRIFGEDRVYYLPEIRTALRRAAKDERVAGLEVEMGQVSGTPAEFTELRRIFEEVAQGGKKVRVVLADVDNWAYFAAAVPGVTVTLNPTAQVMLPGPYFQLIYLGDALKKLGVNLEVLRAGKYKSAFEPLVANEPSAPTLEQYGSMEKSLRDFMIDSVAAGRKKDKEAVRQWFKRSIYTADEAQKEGLVDELGYATTRVEATTESLEKDGVVRFVDYAAATANKQPLQESVEGQGGIALIEAVGEITMNEAQGTTGGDAISPRQMRRQLRWALDEDDVKAVVLRVSSPGGSATASDLIWRDVDLLAQKKPVIVSMGAYAASGGYYISVPAKKLVAEASTITGSIGVIGALPNFAPFKEKYGVSFYAVTETDRKNLLNPGASPSPEDKQLMEGSIDQTYKTFVSKVAAGRNLAVEKVEQLAQGRVYTGLEAKELGLVDEIGGLQTAFKAAKELAGFDVNKLYPVLHYEGERFSLAECLGNPAKMMRCFSTGGARLDARKLAEQVLLAESDVTTVESLALKARHWVDALRSGEALALWPGYIGAQVR